VVQVCEVQNEAQWEDYLIRRENIKQDIDTSMVDTRTGRALPSDFRFAGAETEKPLSEAQALAASEDLRVKIPASAKSHGQILAPNPFSETKLLLFAPAEHDYSSDCVFAMRDLIANELPGPALETLANEAWLFHGTKPVAAESIASNNFRLDLAGSSAGALYGRGIYLAENCTKADEYCRPDPRTGLLTMLLCRTTLGKLFYSAEVKPDTRICEQACLTGDCHSVLGDRKACRGTFREFCVFDEDQVYPNYLVNYRRVMPGVG